MKKSIIIFCITLKTLVAAQVGINTVTPGDGSIFDVTATDKGILIPRVDIADLSTIAPIVVASSAAEGLMVYNTNTTTGKGFYYWTGSAWAPIEGDASNAWALDGNTGTTPGTGAGQHFIGTTNAQDFVIATNSTEKMRVYSDGRIAVNESSPTANDRFTVTAPAGTVAYAANTSAAGGFSYLANHSGLGSVGFYTLSFTGGSSLLGATLSANTTAVLGSEFSNGVGVTASNSGTGIGLQVTAFNSADAVAINNSGSGNGITSQITSGYGFYNELLANNTGIYTDLDAAGGIGELIDLGTEDGTGVFVSGVDNIVTPTAGGDVYAFDAIVDTATPTGVSINGTVFSGIQNGEGHGIIINHNGTQGRNAEFNINNSSNADPAIVSISQGTGTVIEVENQNNAIGSAISVASFAYTGTEVEDHIGVSGFSDPTSGTINFGIGTAGYGGWIGVLGLDGSGFGDPFSYGVFSAGDSGSTGTKAFTIDHPLDPSNKILKHFSVESNEILNMYRGKAIFDANGKALIQLPNYYTAINKNESYQLTPIGTAMPNLYIEKEIENGEFIIAGGIAGKKVSWTITAERNDLYLKNNPQKRAVEIDKGLRKGQYLMPTLYNQPKDKFMGVTSLLSKKQPLVASKQKEPNALLSIEPKSHKNITLDEMSRKYFNMSEKELNQKIKEAQNKKE